MGSILPTTLSWTVKEGSKEGRGQLGFSSSFMVVVPLCKSLLVVLFLCVIGALRGRSDLRGWGDLSRVARR